MKNSKILYDTGRDFNCDLVDPDYGFELRPEVEESLNKSIKSRERIPVEKITEEMGLKW